MSRKKRILIHSGIIKEETYIGSQADKLGIKGGQIIEYGLQVEYGTNIELGLYANTFSSNLISILIIMALDIG